MAAALDQRYTSGRGLAELWTGFLLAPLAWALHLSVSYFLADVACEGGWLLLLPGASVLFGAAALAGAWFAWTGFQRTGREWPHGDDGGVVMRSRFLAVGGLLLSAISLLLIVAQTIPLLFLRPCV